MPAHTRQFAIRAEDKERSEKEDSDDEHEARRLNASPNTHKLNPELLHESHSNNYTHAHLGYLF